MEPIIGERLKKLRLEKGLSLEDVHKKTKIHLNILKAIEEDNLINFNAVYIKGFLKIYCKFLGVDPKDYIPDYKQPQTINYYADTKETCQGFSAKTALNRFNLLMPQLKLRPVLTVVLILVFIIGILQLGKIIALKKQRLVKYRSGAGQAGLAAPGKSKQALVNKGKRVMPQDTATAAKQENLPLNIKAAASSGLRLSIRAKEDCWVQLKADGRLIFQNQLRKGRSETWQAKNKIELSLGNAGNVDLEVNGRLISGIGRKNQAVKNILITREGLTVPR